MSTLIANRKTADVDDGPPDAPTNIQDVLFRTLVGK